MGLLEQEEVKQVKATGRTWYKLLYCRCTFLLLRLKNLPRIGAAPGGTRPDNASEMNVNDLQDDYDDYDDYGGDETTLPSTLSGYAQQPPPASTYSPPQQASTSALPQSYSPPVGGNSYGGGSSYGGGGLGNMSSMGSSLPSTSPPGQPNKYGGGDKCPRCGKTVYFAEAKEGPNNIKYHKYVLIPCILTSLALCTVGFKLTCPW